MIKYLFPFEKIEKGSNIVIYGAGVIGYDYIMQIDKTAWVNIICVLDKNYQDKDSFHEAYTVMPPEYIRSIDEIQYSYVLIAIETAESKSAAEQALISLGVSESKIIWYRDRVIYTDYKYSISHRETKIIPDDGGNILKIAILARGGLGDALFACIFAKEIRKIVIDSLIIDFIIVSKSTFEGFPFLDKVAKLDNNNISEDDGYDAVFNFVNKVLIDKASLKKIQRFSDVLYNYCINEISIYNNMFHEDFSPYIYYELVELKQKKQIEASDLEGLIPINRYTPLYMEWAPSSFNCIKKFGLNPGHYITIGNGIGSALLPTHPKVWLPEYYDKLVLLIKSKYSNIQIVNIGENNKLGQIKNVDVDLVGKTSIDELKTVLKYSLLHIGPEGGLVHLKHFLHGKSVVIFGGSSISLCGYEDNYNLRSELACCNGSCFLFKINYRKAICPFNRRSRHAMCMELLRPETVFDKVAGFLDELKVCNYYQEKKLAPEDLGTVFGAADNVALINRVNDGLVLQYTKQVKKITVYDRDLTDGETSDEAPINCKYINTLREHNATAEYGFIYNIPAEDELYDVVVNFTYSNEAYPDKALAEMLRITKVNGCVAVLSTDGELTIIRKTPKL